MTTKSDPYGGDVLPDDPGLDAFVSMVNKATKPKERKSPRPEDADKAADTDSTATKQEPDLRGVAPERTVKSSNTSPKAAVTVKHSAADVADDDVDVVVGKVVISIPDLGKAGTRSTQGLVMVSSQVRDRIAHYQAVKKQETGSEPTNAVVIRRAFLAARKAEKFAELLQVLRTRHQPIEDEDDDPDGLFGHVEGRRAARGRVKNSVQQSFRPSLQELATIDAFAEAYGFPSRSDLVDAVLDDFLPPLPRPEEATRRAPRRRKVKSEDVSTAKAGPGEGAVSADEKGRQESQ